MPKELNNRLEILEQEINCLLTLQSECAQPMPCRVITVQGVRSGSQLSTEPRTRTCVKTQSYSCPSAAFSDVPGGIETPRERDIPSGEGHIKKRLHEEQERVEQAHKVIQSLKEELCVSKTRMCTMAKDMALLTTALQNIRAKYKNIKTYRKDAMFQIQQLQTCNADLCHKLQQEMHAHQEQIKDIKDKESVRFEQKVRTEAVKRTEEIDSKFKRIQNQNETLKQDMQELNAKYMIAQNEIDNLKDLLDGQQKDYTSKMKESDDLKTLLRSEKNKNKIISATIDKLEYTVNELLKIEKKSQQEICQLHDQLHKLESQNKNQHETISVKNQECDELDKECQRLRHQIQELSVDDNNKCRKIESEMERLKKEMRDNEFLIEEERTNLKTLIQELNDVVKQHRTRIRELLHINRQQEGLLEKQKIVITNKEHESQVTQIALDNSRQKSVCLEDQLEKLKSCLRNYESKQMKEHETQKDNSSKVKSLMQDLDKTKVLLQEEKDKQLIKEKIIEDQSDTIQKLKTTIQLRTEDFKQLRSELDKVERDLENEQADKEQLQRNIEDITTHKQELRDQIIKLEETIKQNSSSEPKKLLSSLEKQVCMKQKEWELRCQLLSTEKQRAVQAAKFATQKLVDTVNDFQSQAENQKQVQDMLTNIVQNKSAPPSRKSLRHKSPVKCQPATCPKKRVSFQY